MNKEQAAEICLKFKVNQISQLSLVFTVSLTAIIINNIATCIFQNIVSFEKSHSKGEEVLSLFKKIVILQFIDTAIINFIVNQYILPESYRNNHNNILTFLFGGERNDFDNEWYEDVGQPLMRVLWLNIALYPLGWIGTMMHLCKRQCDRGCKSRLIEADGTLNTKQETQEEL